MSFKPFVFFREQRIARAMVGLLALAGAAFAQYRLANVPMPVSVETIGDFSPAKLRLGQEELIIEGPVVNSEEGMLFSHDGRANEIVDVSFDHARLDEQTIGMLESSGLRPPSTPVKIDYVVQESTGPSTGGEPCRSRVELRTISKMPAEIHIFQLGTPGQNHYRNLEMKTIGAELVSHMLTESPDDSNFAPGCLKLLKVGDWNQRLTRIAVSAIVAEDSALRFNFRSLTPDSKLWDDTGGFFEPLDLGVQKLNPNDPPPFQARAVSIRSLGGRDSTSAPPTLASARSADDGPLLIVSSLRVGSDQLQVSISGKGWVKINGEDKTVNFLDRVKENPLPSGVLASANAALLAWVARLILKSPSTSHQPKHYQRRSRRFERRRKGNAKKRD